MPDSPLIVTAKIDEETQKFFDDLRRKHFPPERNFLSAHITLFHHLPAEKIFEIEDLLERIASDQQIFTLNFSSVRFLGRGTAIEIESPELIDLHKKLAAHWRDVLTNQDKQKFKPHVTIQNKVAPDEAEKLFEQLKNNWKPKKGNAVGLHLWHYRGGPWESAKEFDFKENLIY